ncbi:hypothetical protein AS026_03820 [Rhizobium altiplani]|uniref:Peroxidase n=1 Tax=Rhizobium altiplani TaxID=1864509 RepID=A0A120FLZ4_9HYPH|nr:MULTISPECIES: hypothetical protein [Rhizobium]KWV53012.1 hypothetical protein AS026_03820 [Rhizobium altiplani]
MSSIAVSDDTRTRPLLWLLTGDPVWVEKLALDPNNAELSDREQTLVRYGLKLTVNPADIAPSDLDTLRTAGLDEPAILELAHLVAYYNLSNRLMTGLGVRPTDQAYFAHRSKE